MTLFGIELCVIFKFVYLFFSLSFIKDNRIKLNSCLFYQQYDNYDNSISNNTIIVQYVKWGWKVLLICNYISIIYYVHTKKMWKMFVIWKVLIDKINNYIYLFKCIFWEIANIKQKIIKKYYLLEIGSYNTRIVNVLLDYLF